MSDTPAPNGTGLLTVHDALQVYTDLVQRLGSYRHGVTFGTARDLYQTLGYKRDLEISDYRERYQRGGIAFRIIEAFPAATWRLPPLINEVGKADEATRSPFEDTVQSLVDRLRLWQQCVRVDRLASLGHYAVLILGLRGQTNWAEDARPVQKAADLLYIQSYSEEHATIRSLVSEDGSPLFGKPARYDVDFSRRLSRNLVVDTLLRPTLAQQYGTLIDVHASRLIHVAENGLEDDLIGTPRLRAVWNCLDDLEKVMGGSGEMFWQDAKRRIVLSLEKDAQMSDAAAVALTAEVEEFVHELRNFLRVQGMDVTQLAGHIPDPTGNVEKLLDLIAGTVGMPKRLLMGSERGELASTQDESNWSTRIHERQVQYAEPLILRPFLDRCIALNILPVPQQGYTVEWPSLEAQSEVEKSAVALNWSRALKEYAGAFMAPAEVLPLQIYLADVWGWSTEQVERVLEELAETPPVGTPRQRLPGDEDPPEEGPL